MTDAPEDPDGPIAQSGRAYRGGEPDDRYRGRPYPSGRGEEPGFASPGAAGGRVRDSRGAVRGDAGLSDPRDGRHRAGPEGAGDAGLERDLGRAAAADPRDGYAGAAGAQDDVRWSAGAGSWRGSRPGSWRDAPSPDDASGVEPERGGSSWEGAGRARASRGGDDDLFASPRERRSRGSRGRRFGAAAAEAWRAAGSAAVGVGSWWRRAEIRRRAAAMGAPIIIAVSLGAGLAAFPPTRDLALQGLERVRTAILARPELRIRHLDITFVGPAAPRLSDAEIVTALALEGPRRSALAFDAEDARSRLQKLGWVKTATVALRPPNTLEITIEERAPAFVWRNAGALAILGADGRFIAPAQSRVAAARIHPGAELLVGPDADRAAVEGGALLAAARAAGLSPIGLTRVRGRRWDMDLLGGPRLMLPAENPAAALRRFVGWIETAGVMREGFSVVDLRLGHAPVGRRGPLDVASAAPAAGAGRSVR